MSVCLSSFSPSIYLYIYLYGELILMTSPGIQFSGLTKLLQSHRTLWNTVLTGWILLPDVRKLTFMSKIGGDSVHPVHGAETPCGWSPHSCPSSPQFFYIQYEMTPLLLHSITMIPSDLCGKRPLFQKFTANLNKA